MKTPIPALPPSPCRQPNTRAASPYLAWPCGLTRTFVPVACVVARLVREATRRFPVATCRCPGAWSPVRRVPRCVAWDLRPGHNVRWCWARLAPPDAGVLDARSGTRSTCASPDTLRDPLSCPLVVRWALLARLGCGPLTDVATSACPCVAGQRCEASWRVAPVAGRQGGTG